jgi:DNA-directed RNA polymerase specialized sigma24 family protein
MAHDFTSSFDARGKGPRDAYLEEFLTCANLRLKRGKHWRMHEHDRDDVAAAMTIRVLSNIDDYVARYPRPEKLVGVMLDQAVLGHHRKQAVQQGRGARFGREMVYLDGLTDDPTGAWDHDTVGEAETIGEAAEMVSMLEAALIGRGVKDRNLALLRMVDGHGVTVTEAADRLGIRRETASRILKKVREAAKAEVAQWKIDGISYPDRET